MRVSAYATLVSAACLLVAACATQASPAAVEPRSESEKQGWSGTASAPDAAQIADGRRIAERECSSCHAIDARSKSPNPTAPPLRDVLAMNDPDALAYRFIDAMRVGHDEMPRFDFDIRAADALIAYLESIN